jgi:hypothetical protein
MRVTVAIDCTEYKLTPKEMNFMNKIISTAASVAKQNILEQTAERMSHLHQYYDFSLTTLPPKTHSEGCTAADFGEDLARMMILELKNCGRYSVKQIQLSTERIRTTYASYLVSREFRKAMKGKVLEWSLLEAERKSFNREHTEWLVRDLDTLANLYLSPVGIADADNNLIFGGYPYPLKFATLGNSEPDEKEFAKFHQRLPQFEGILDWVDEDTARSIVEMLPEVVVSPCWYDQEDIEGCESTDNVDRLHEALCDEYPALEEKHTITVDDGFCKSITVAEFEGQASPDSPYRLLVATMSYEGTAGGDVYLALKTPYLCRTVLLVSPELEYETGPCVIGHIYRAFAEAIWRETGESIDIDDLLEELEDTSDAEEV